MNYKLLQIKDVENCKYAFGGYDTAMKNSFSVGDYEVVYEGEVDRVIYNEENGDNICYTLEYLFTVFNTDQPMGFLGHSMSVSDVIELDGELYYTDHIGFKKIG